MDVLLERAANCCITQDVVQCISASSSYSLTSITIRLYIPSDFVHLSLCWPSSPEQAIRDNCKPSTSPKTPPDSPGPAASFWRSEHYFITLALFSFQHLNSPTINTRDVATIAFVPKPHQKRNQPRQK